MVKTWMIAGNMSIAACKLQLSVHSCDPKYQPVHLGGSLKIFQLTQLQASVTQDYFDKAEEESKNVQDIKYQEEVWQEIERKQMQHFYMADWTTSIPLKILWHGFNLSHHITQNTSPLFCSKIKP